MDNKIVVGSIVGALAIAAVGTWTWHGQTQRDARMAQLEKKSQEDRNVIEKLEQDSKARQAATDHALTQSQQTASSQQRELTTSGAQAHVRQAFSYMASAKTASNRRDKEEFINNAINEFSQAIAKSPTFAEAYANRAVAYMVSNKPNKAEEDLKRALELDSKNASIRYNLAALYSLTNRVDLSLEQLNEALKAGFNNYDLLKLDPDLSNVRASNEFRKVLEKNKVFIF